MLYVVYLKKRTVYVPTVARLATGVYDEIEPVAEVPVTDTDGIRKAITAAIARGNRVVPNPPKDNWPPPIMLKYAGAKTWSTFMRETATWHITEYNGLYEIVGHRVHLPKGNATPDPEQKISLPPGSTASDAVDRVIDILKNAARE